MDCKNRLRCTRPHDRRAQECKKRSATSDCTGSVRRRSDWFRRESTLSPSPKSHLAEDHSLQALIALCFCIGDLEATASTSTGVPVIEIILNSTQSVVGATCLCALITVIVSGASNSLTAEGGRAVYAFARDQ